MAVGDGLDSKPELCQMIVRDTGEFEENCFNDRIHHSSPPELRNENTGRLDAGQIANFFGLSLNEFARLLGRPHTSVHKTPDSVRLKNSLYPYERVLSAAKHILGDEKTMRTFKIWLN